MSYIVLTNLYNVVVILHTYPPPHFTLLILVEENIKISRIDRIETSRRRDINALYYTHLRR